MRVRIMRGLPGSGKSHFGSEVLPRIFNSDPTICSADHFFTGADGVYRFDAAKLADAHFESRHAFFNALNPSEDQRIFPNLIVVDNTNTMPTEIAFYYDLATLFTKDVEILTLEPPPILDTEDWLQQCFSENQHGVPLANIRAMHDRMKKHKLPWYWREKIVTREDGFFTLNGTRYDA